MGHDSTSPYAAPQSNVQTDKEKFLEVIPAGKWKRFFNFIIDQIAFYIVVILLTVVAMMIFGEEILQRMENISQLQDILISYLVYFSYYLIFESFTGRTIGKFITGTRVVNEDGGKATPKQVLYRSLCRLIPFEPFSFLGRDGYGWHDSIPNTYVIDTRKQNK